MKLRGWLLAAATTSFAALSGAALGYPEKPVVFVVPYGPGGPSDLGARVMQPAFKNATGHELVIQNRPGAGGATAWSQLNSMPGDGYTTMLTAMPHIILQPVVNQPSGYETEDITIVLVYGYLPEVLAVPKASKFQTVKDLVAAAQASPGRITIAGTGVGGGNHAAQALFDRAAGVRTAYVPFKDTASGNAALMGSQVDTAWTWLSQGLTLKDNIRMLAVASEERVALAPSLPTLKELGYNVTSGAWWAVAVPKSTPENLRRQVSQSFAKVIQDKQYQAKMSEFGYVTMAITYPAVSDFVKQKTSEYRPIAQQIKAKK
ncbi:MAG TPA: tripartite tricarboxylate transporter substrate binding protein [Burkholderiales bacterium]|jgi:tripartite-type tricarboxylate transporter receptor subunit TctC|nr:tripartite tricarboxylate transporter substrate binding protein [Burkholderiales bacterium]